MRFRELKYYLYNETGEYFIPVTIKKPKILMEFPPILVNEFSESIKKLDLDKIITSDEIKNFWKYSTENQKFALLVSYFMAKYKRELVAVEIDNWFLNDFFKNTWKDRKNKTKINNIHSYKEWYEAMISTTCVHNEGIRFDNVHLAYDIIEKKDIYTVHWDIFFPGESTKSLIEHNIKEVLKINSKK